MTTGRSPDGGHGDEGPPHALPAASHERLWKLARIPVAILQQKEAEAR